MSTGSHQGALTKHATKEAADLSFQVCEAAKELWDTATNRTAEAMKAEARQVLRTLTESIKA